MDQIEPRLLLKITPPRAARRLLERPSLAPSGPLLRDRVIIRVEAPAGFGKTSLLSQWRRAWLAEGAAVAWLNVDAGDDVADFAQALALAMERATGRAAFACLRQAQASGPAQFGWLTEWLSEVTHAGAESVLILDEVEALPAETQQSTLDYLLRNLPPNLRVVLASRKRLRLRLADLAARGAVALLDADRLRFTLADTVAVLQSQFQERIGLDAAAGIHELTQGWPLGLQLVVSALEQGQDVREISDPAVRHRAGFERGFFDALLARMPVPQQDFLVRCCVLRRLHPGLCMAVTGHGDARRTLVELTETTPLLTALDDDWYTLHPMAREFLKGRFDRLPEGVRNAVHAAASAWLAANGAMEDAADHALRAGIQGQAWELAERALPGMLARGEVARVQAWFKRASLPKKEQRPSLLLVAGWSYALGGRHADAQALARRVQADGRSSAEERAGASALLASSAVFADRIDEAADLIRAWGRRADGEQNALDGRGFNQLAWLALQQGDPAQAHRLLHRAVDHHGFGFIAGFRFALEGAAYQWEGHATRAAQVLQRALDLAEAHTGRRDPVTVTLAGLLALASWDNGQPWQAELVLANRLDAIETLATPAALAAGYIAAARVAHLHGQEARAHELLAAAGAIARQRRMPRILMLMQAEAIRLHALAGHAETCAGLLVRMEQAFKSMALPSTSLLLGPLQLVLAVARARVSGARGDWPRALQLLQDAGPLAQRLRRGADVVEIQLLRACALHACGREFAAELREAVQLAEAFGLNALLAEGPVQTLRRLLAQKEGTTLPPEPGVVPPAGAAEPARSAPVVAPTPLLTPKERDILGLLVRHMSNKQIAAALDVGDATIKWHLKNVFSKLHAVSRDHAVQRARMLGIIELH